MINGRITSLRTYWRLAVCVLACSVVLASAPSADRYVAPVEIMRGTIIAEATINGKVKANLIVDTGAGPALVITSRLAQRIRDAQPEPAPDEERSGENSGPVESPLGPGPPKIETLQWGEITARDITPMALDLGFVTERTGIEIDGIIGVGVFGKYITTFDYQGEKVILDDTGDRAKVSAELRAAGADVIPYEIITADQKIVLPVRIGDAPEEKLFILDTGASKLGIFQKSFEAVGQATEAWPRLDGIDVATVMGEHDASVVRVPKIALSRSSVEGVDCTVSDNPLAKPLSWLAGKDVAGLLGYSFLKHFKLTIDYQDKKVYLVAYDPYKEKYPDEYNTIGVGLRLRAGRKVLQIVVPGSPAEGAGIKPKDILLEIDGRRADDMTLEECRLALEGEPGTKVEVTVLRNAKEIRFDVERKNLL
jgi:predicted aspartyl protease